MRCLTRLYLARDVPVGGRIELMRGKASRSGFGWARRNARADNNAPHRLSTRTNRTASRATLVQKCTLLKVSCKHPTLSTFFPPSSQQIDSSHSLYTLRAAAARAIHTASYCYAGMLKSRRSTGTGSYSDPRLCSIGTVNDSKVKALRPSTVTTTMRSISTTKTAW